MGLFSKLFRSIFGGRAVIKVPQYSPPKIPSATKTKLQQSAPKIPIPNRVIAGITIVERINGRARVEDGDTIYIGGVSIRLAGIDAPEIGDPYSNNAKFALIALCKGHLITAQLEDHSSHGRHVATCYLPDGRDLSAEMVKLGLALDWRKFSGGKYRHLEPEGTRKKLWRVEAKHQGRRPPNTR
ncbi:MAG: thermonuclease family protein [Cypionkella sp.]